MTKARNYQNEQPVDTDLFGGQGHKQVADAIASVLLTDSTQHIIGIEGNLGSGKSTVISILQQKIVESGFHVVTFDADQYHTTLKSALIQIIEAELKSLISKKNKYQLAKLAVAVETALGKRLEYTKSTTSHIPFQAIIFAFSLAVSALQLKPAIKFIFERIKDVPDLDMLSGNLSLVLFASPVLVYLGMKLLGINTGLGDLVKRNSRDTISEVIDVNREVGAIELKEAFGTFSSLIPKDRTLLLVVDNIDRVSPDIARELWSDIEILTALGSERFRILLPYSEEHLAKALEKSAVDESQSGKEFISKRIPVPFSAPPIVTTGWRDQFEAYWQETLPDIEGREGVKDLIEIWATKITPRYLKGIVNRIGAKIDSCPEPNNLLNGTPCAAYLMAVRDGKTPVNILLSAPQQEVAPETDIQRKLKATHRVLLKFAGTKEEWAKQIAALHFQTTFLIAQSELIAEPIRSAINTLDATKLMELSSLLGFEVYFRQSLTTTSTSDLVKITASLAQVDNSAEVINKYLGDINHEIKNATHGDYEFDMDLIVSYQLLLDHDIEIDLSVAKYQQEQVTTNIRELTKELEVTNHFDSEIAPSWEDLEEPIKQRYEYYLITGERPYFINHPSAAFVVNALYPIEKALSQWGVKNLIHLLPTDKLVTAAVARKQRPNSSVNIFPLLMEKMRIGEFHGLRSESLLNIPEIDLDKISQLINELPFTSQWHSQDTAYASVLSRRLHSIDDDDLTQYTALWAASLINELPPSSTLGFINANGSAINKTAENAIAERLKEQPETASFLTNYLSFCPFEKVLNWCMNPTTTSLLMPRLEALISAKRIQRLDVNLLLNDGYVFLKNNSKILTPQAIIKWMEGWSKAALHPLSWDIELIEDIFKCNSKIYISKLQQYFDKPDLSQEEWLNRIETNDPVFGKVANRLASTYFILKDGKTLQQTLKELPEGSGNYNAELVITLTSLIDKQKINGIRISLTSKFFKDITSFETKYRIIRYFGSIISMPTIKDSSLETEAIAFLDDAITNDHEQAKSWLLAQPSDGSGWNISSWSKDNLTALSGLLSDDPSTQKGKLADIVAQRLNTLNNNDKQGNTAKSPKLVAK